MTEQQKQSIRTALLGVYCKGVLHEPIDTTAFLDFALQEILDILQPND